MHTHFLTWDFPMSQWYSYEWYSALTTDISLQDLRGTLILFVQRYHIHTHIVSLQYCIPLRVHLARIKYTLVKKKETEKTKMQITISTMLIEEVLQLGRIPEMHRAITLFIVYLVRVLR